MKQYKFTIVVRSPMDVKDMVWAFTHKLKDAFPIVSISFDEVSDRPTTVEHHGGIESEYYSPDLEDVDHNLEDEVLKEDLINNGESSEHTEEWLKRNIPERY